MKIYNIKLKILTPIHIGDGSELLPYEYVIKDNKFYKIRLDDFIINLSPENKKQVLHQIENGKMVELRKLLKALFDPKIHKWDYSTDVSKEVANLYELKIDSEINKLVIFPFIKSMDKIYIPGSSIKGAIRTAVFYKFLANDFEKNKNYNDLEPLTFGYSIWDEKEKKYKPRLENDPFRAIKFPDIFLSEGYSKIEEVETLTGKGNIKMLVETTHSQYSKKEFEFDGEMRIDDLLLAKNKNIKFKIDIDTIKNSCNEFYKDVVIPYEARYLKQLKINPKVYEDLKISNNSFLIRLGWGIGKNSITVNLKKQRPQFIKSRKLIGGGIPLGWVEITIV